MKMPKSATCIVCGKEGYETNHGWVENPVLDGQGEPDGPWWDGDSLPDAYEYSHGFVCSNRCYSQSMYDAASERQKRALRAVLDAVRVIYDNIEEANEALEEAGMDPANNSEDFLDCIYADEEPEWTNRLSREEQLENAATDAKVKLSSCAYWDHAWYVINRLQDPKPLTVLEEITLKEHARHAGSFAAIALNLKEAIDA